MHAATSEAVEYLPTAQAVQVVAPVLEPVFMIEPAGQTLHADEPSVAAYLPAGHAIQAATFDAIEYLPTAHLVQVLAPVLAPVFVIEP